MNIIDDHKKHSSTQLSQFEFKLNENKAAIIENNEVFKQISST